MPTPLYGERKEIPARRVAAEHFAFCPDLADMTTLDDRARSLVDAEVWAFWWD
jgi:hypothetical protein